jgi:hypothetical protein
MCGVALKLPRICTIFGVLKVSIKAWFLNALAFLAWLAFIKLAFFERFSPIPTIEDTEYAVELHHH